MKCKYCDGRGYYETLNAKRGASIETLADCPRCKGTGRATPPKNFFNNAPEDQK